jgi:hypothetical protein
MRTILSPPAGIELLIEGWLKKHLLIHSTIKALLFNFVFELENQQKNKIKVSAIIEKIDNSLIP